MAVDLKLELVPVPTTDVDRAKAFYERAGFVCDVDTGLRNGMRVVQLTPPGSACSICIGVGIVNTAPGSIQGLQLVVDDIDAARGWLIDRGVEVAPVRHLDDTGTWVDGKGGPWNSFAMFDDPDGNGWVLQEKPADA